MPRRTVVAVATIAALAAAWPVPAQSAGDDARYRTAIERTKAMVGDQRVIDLAAREGLDVLDVTWEDTGRFLDSSVGPNISDMTIQVQTCDEDQQGQETCQLDLMPVLRFPNYSDKTGDVPLDRFSVLVGNEQGEPLRRVSLKDVLGDLRSYLHDGDSWGGSRTSLLAPRDTHALVSAQAAFLPVPRGGDAEFNPVLFNYQSVPGDPAVLTLLATREGTSVTVIDNVRDGFQAGQTWGQRLFFNQDGERASLTGTRAERHGPDRAARRAARRPGRAGRRRGRGRRAQHGAAGAGAAQAEVPARAPGGVRRRAMMSARRGGLARAVRRRGRGHRPRQGRGAVHGDRRARRRARRRATRSA